MKTRVFHFLKQILPPFITNSIKKRRHPSIIKSSKSPNLSLINSYSQYQEDLILDAIFRKDDGFYVDIGANDPEKFSNTYRFYLRGWTGINIEPQPKKIALFESKRQKDINLNLGIDTEPSELDFYNLKTDTLSTFDEALAKNHCNRFKTEIEEIIPVKVDRLDQVFKDHLPPSVEIDFMSIDTEGFDTKVIMSNDWEKYRPRVVVIEVGDQVDFIMDFFDQIDYCLVYKNSCNFLFMDLKSSLF